MSRERRKSSFQMSGLVISRRASPKQKMVKEFLLNLSIVGLKHTENYLIISGTKHNMPKQMVVRRVFFASVCILHLVYLIFIKATVAIDQLRIYQPTYQLNPRKRFDAEVVEKILQRIVKSELEQLEYSEKVVPDMCLTLTETIKTAIKEENYDRYRIIVGVTIGQRRQQSVHMFHSFLWDHERDAFASHNFENCHIFANVVVYAVYFD